MPKAKQALTLTAMIGIVLYMIGKALMTVGGMIMIGFIVSTLVTVMMGEIKKKVKL